MKLIHASCAMGLVATLVGCGDSSSSLSEAEANRGTLNSVMPQLSVLDAQSFKSGFVSGANSASLAGALQYINTGSAPAGAPSATQALPCDFTVSKISYNTVGAVGEAATATAAVMVPVPTNANPKCNGPFPVVLAAHGTSVYKDNDVSNFAVSTEGSLYGAIFAAQGYVVVAPNYAGYDSSSLTYHPYLILSQQSKDMQDALAAAKAAKLFKANAKLFVTGYSQGGAVALATQRDLEAAGVIVFGSAPGSGPYAMLSFGDTIFAGKPNNGGTLFAPLLIDAAQKAYGNLYSTPLDLYNAPFASTVPGLMPGISLNTNATFSDLLYNTSLFLPANNSENAVYGIGNVALFTSAARSAYNSDATANPVNGTSLPGRVGNPLRQALLKNDLRSGWVPKAPTRLCGADNDPTVFIENTNQFKAYADARSATNPVVVANLSAAITGASDPYAALKQAYSDAGLKAITLDAALRNNPPNVHSNIAPFCYLAAHGMFKSIAWPPQ
jgi:hypothetical protein